MKNGKRFMALLLAAVLVCSQVPSIGSSVTAEETKLSTESTTTSSSSSESETSDGDSVSTGDQTPIVLTFAMMLLAAAILLAGAAYRKMFAGR
ncbi:MAG: hypothetical protein LUI14_14000 [Lachnospiraceae bacterium]|nr:hypothetical protein [Lachnospiraceae bacterium]